MSRYVFALKLKYVKKQATKKFAKIVLRLCFSSVEFENKIIYKVCILLMMFFKRTGSRIEEVFQEFGS